MVNVFSFDIVNTNSEQPRMFSIKFDGQILLTKKIINCQETIQFEFDNNPGRHLLELLLIDTPGSKAKIAVGNFKINRCELVDSRLKTLFQGPTKFDGFLQGLVKFQLTIDTPVLSWQQKNRIY
jgi:hypothetical protein